jgi:HlyD family secretion protein
MENADRRSNKMAQTTDIGIGEVLTRDPEDKNAPSPPAHGSRRGTPKSAKKPALIVIAALLCIGLAVGGILWSRRGVITVQAGKVMRQNLSAIVTASGQIMPPPGKFATVNANSFGKVTEILVQEGDRVQKGQLLMQTEDVQQAANVDSQKAALLTAHADLSATQAAVDSAAAALKTSEANLAQAQAKFNQAQGDFRRNQELYKDQLIARQVFDQSLSDFEVAKANVQSAQAQLAQQKALLQQAIFNRDMRRASVAQNEAALVGAEDVYNQTIYRSPFSGIITSLPVHVGENVVPGIQNAVGSVLFQVSDLSVVTAQVDVDESDILSVKIGQPAEVTIDAIPNKTFKGHVTQVGMNAIAQSSGTSAAGSASTTQEAKDFQVVVTLDSPPPGMRPGLSATARITTATVNNAITIPIQALTMRERRELEPPSKSSGAKALAAESLTSAEEKKEDQDIQGAFLIRNGRAIFTRVKTGIMGTMNVQVLSGLRPGDEIVTGSYEVLRTLKNNAKVKVNDKAVLGPNGPMS